MPERIRLAAARVLDWHLSGIRRLSGLPDLPEVRRLMRANWLRGFTFGACPGLTEMAAMRTEARAAIARHQIDPRAKKET